MRKGKIVKSYQARGGGGGGGGGCGNAPAPAPAVPVEGVVVLRPDRSEKDQGLG